MYTIDSERMKSRPELRLGDRVFAVDDRLSVFEQMNRRIREGGDSEFEVIIGMALGAEALAAILEMDLGYAVMRDIVVNILAAIQGLPEDEARARFRS